MQLGKSTFYCNINLSRSSTVYWFTDRHSTHNLGFIFPHNLRCLKMLILKICLWMFINELCFLITMRILTTLYQIWKDSQYMHQSFCLRKNLFICCVSIEDGLLFRILLLWSNCFDSYFLFICVFISAFTVELSS